MNQEDAFNYLIHCLRNPRDSGYSNYGYDVYLPNVMRAYLHAQERMQDVQADRKMRELSPHFYAAAWELCRRGILRPGVTVLGAQETGDGSAGNGYSVTPFGRTRLAESDRDDFVPTEPDRFAQMLKPFQARFGPGFYERAQEAVRCYGAHAYLACCAMCGAAAESILLAIAIVKKDEAEVLRSYASVQGRSRVEAFVLGQARQELQREFRAFTILLKYWRDEAAHGKKSGIMDNEAYTSLALLLRFAQYAADHWDELTANSQL